VTTPVIVAALVGAVLGLLAGALADRAARWSVRADERGPLGPRTALAVGAGAVLGALMPIIVGVDLELAAWWWWAWGSIALVRVDLARHRLPDVVVGPFVLGAAVLLLLPTIADGAWSDYGRAWAAAGVLFVGYLVLAIISPAGMGMGDVKLAPAIGLYVGWLGWSWVLVGTMAGFVLAALVGVAMVARSRSRGREAWQQALPFGPFMVAGVAVAVVGAAAGLG
jgi:leader peptidase (prepilin peptidase)/N-methyltransferase